MKVFFWALSFLLLLNADPARAQESTVSCGIASGFPPYQFVLSDEPAGFDVDVARAVCARLGLQISFAQAEWENVLNMLRFGKVDFIAGMEVNSFRNDYFDFTAPYSKRHDVVFVPASSTLSTVEDLFGRIITGDRHSFVELQWREQGIYNKIRIMQAKTKEEAMTLMAQGQSVAAIMPLEVGKHLAKEMGIKVRVLINPDPGSEVAFALRKDQPELKQKLNKALEEIRASGELDALAFKWFGKSEGAGQKNP